MAVVAIPFRPRTMESAVIDPDLLARLLDLLEELADADALPADLVDRRRGLYADPASARALLDDVLCELYGPSVRIWPQPDGSFHVVARRRYPRRKTLALLGCGTTPEEACVDAVAYALILVA